MFNESVDVQVQATSADGTEVPFTCLRGGSDSEGHLPTLVYAHGGADLCFSFSSQIFVIGLLFLLLHISTLLRHVVFRVFIVFMPFPFTVSAIVGG